MTLEQIKNDALMNTLEPLLERWARLEPGAIQRLVQYGSRWSVSVVTGGTTALTIGSPQTPLKIRHAVIMSAARHGCRLKPELPLPVLLSGLLEQLPLMPGYRQATEEELTRAALQYGNKNVWIDCDARAHHIDKSGNAYDGIWIECWVRIES